MPESFFMRASTARHKFWSIPPQLGSQGFFFRFLPSRVVCLNIVRNIYSLFLYTVIDLFSDIKAIDSVGDPPLPIPNREVKPVSADGTAKIRGRVGHRHFFRERALADAKALFLFVRVLKGIKVTMVCFTSAGD